MKKIILPILALGMLSVVSCRKDRTCTCTSTYTAAGQSQTEVEETKIGKSNKRVAKNVSGCFSYKQSETINSVAVETTVDCKLD